MKRKSSGGGRTTRAGRWIDPKLLEANRQIVSASERARIVDTPTLRAWFGAHKRTPLYRNSYALVAGGVATSGLGLVYWILAARLYDVHDVGVQSATISTMLFLSGVAEFSLNTVLVRFLPVAGPARARLIFWSYVAGLGAAAVVGCIFLIGTSLWAPSLAFMRRDPAWFGGFVAATALWSIFALQDSVLIGLGQAVWVPVENAIVSLFKIVFLVAQASLAGAGLFLSWNVPAVAAVFVINLFLYRYLVRLRSTPASLVAESLTRRRISRFIGGNYLGSLFVLAGTTLLPLLVLNRAGVREAAYFFPCWAISTAIQLIAANTTLSLIVEVVLDRDHFRLYCRRVLAHTFALVTPAVVVLLLLAPYLLQLFGAAYADEGATLLRWLALAALPNIVVALGLAIARVTDKGSIVAAIQASVSVTLLGGSALLLPRGLTAVGIATLISQSVVAIVLLATILRPLLLPHGRPGTSYFGG